MLAAAGDAATRCERALQVARQSKCPSSAWKDVLMPHLWVDEPSHGPLIYVNAGANKGFAVAEFLQRFHDDRDRSPSNREWHRSVARRAIFSHGMRHPAANLHACHKGRIARCVLRGGVCWCAAQVHQADQAIGHVRMWHVRGVQGG